jgi:Zn-dependent protease with chaperone function
VWQVRVWNTGHQIINAFVAGVVPGLRVIAISDRMVELFPERELLAVVRHEAGHVRLCHVPIRMLFMVLPLVLAATDQANGSAVTTQVAAWLERGAFAWLPPVAWAAVAYVSYLLPMLAWLSRRLEFEADWFSALTEQRDTVGERVHVAAGLDRENQPLDDELAQHNGMTLAIARLAAHSPEQYDRRTIMHPSLRERLQAVASIDVEAAVAGGDLSSMVRQRERLIYGATIVIFVAVVGGFVVA